MRRPRVIVTPVADRYAASGERIIEYAGKNGGGLIALRDIDGRLVVDLYQHDSTVDVRVGQARTEP